MATDSVKCSECNVRIDSPDMRYWIGMMGPMCAKCYGEWLRKIEKLPDQQEEQ
jgi:NAD-dependent SIR2 family protein deacetylase